MLTDHEDNGPGSPEDHFAANLRSLREQLGLSQEALAGQMAERGYRWHQATVYKVETGERRIQLGEATAVAGIVGVPVEKMTEGPTAIFFVGKLRASYNALLSRRDRLEGAARDYEAARWALRSVVSPDEPFVEGSAPTEVLALLSDHERRAMQSAADMDAPAVANQPPF